MSRKKELLVRIEYHGQIWYSVIQQETMGQTHGKRQSDGEVDSRSHNQQIHGRQESKANSVRG